ncbi:MAG: glycosyltransferase [Thermoplasmata archaeon]|nr:glycosyltransferase [Thermoplasmata archaeon]
MRFVFVSETVERVRGGIERHAEGMVAELRRRGHDACVVRPADLTRTQAIAPDWLVFDGVHRSTILRHARQRAGRPGLAIFSHSSFLDEIHLEELWRGGWPPSMHLRARRAFDRWFGRRVFGRFDRWFALTGREATEVEQFLAVPKARISTLGPFVSREFLEAVAAPSHPPPVPAPYICSISRIDRRKNFGMLLTAIEETPYRFVLAGQDRGGLAELEVTARRHPTARWEYLGTVSEEEKVALLRGAAAVVIPSVSEGVPALALEALVLGRPVVLAGLAYGPDGPGVVRCAADPAGLRAALDIATSLPPWPALLPPTVEGSVEAFLAALAGPVRG